MLRQIDDAVDHEHDPRDARLRRSHIFNPCCCMSLTGGAFSVGMGEICLGILDLAFTYFLEKNTKFNQKGGSVDPFYPEYPYYSSNPVIREVERYGCSALSVLFGIILIVTVKWASFILTIFVCVIYLIATTVCQLVALIQAGELLAYEYDYLQERGYQIIVWVVAHVYFLFIILFYGLNIYEDLKDMRAIAPYHGVVELEDDELHMQDINRMHTQDNDIDQNFSRRDQFVHMDVSEFRIQVAESRSSRLMQAKGPLQKDKKNSFNEQEYKTFYGE